VLVNPNDAYAGQSIGPGSGYQLCSCAHRDAADGMPRHPELGGDSRDRGAVDHQPPQHIPGTAPRRGRPRDRQRSQVLVEHRTATLWGQTAVTGHGHPQHQRIASDRQIGQRPGHGVAVSAFGPAVRAARIPGHRTAEDRRFLLVDGSVGDRHPQFDGAHDRVGNNRRRAGSSLRHGSPRRGGCVSVGTRIVTRRGPTSAQRHELSAGNPHHWCTLIRDEPVNHASTRRNSQITGELPTGHGLDVTSPGRTGAAWPWAMCRCRTGDVLPLERAGQHVVVDAPPRGSSWPAPWVTARINRRCEEILFRQQWAGQISVPIVQAQQRMR